MKEGSDDGCPLGMTEESEEGWSDIEGPALGRRLGFMDSEGDSLGISLGPEEGPVEGRIDMLGEGDGRLLGACEVVGWDDGLVEELGCDDGSKLTLG